MENPAVKELAASIVKDDPGLVTPESLPAGNLGGFVDGAAMLLVERVAGKIFDRVKAEAGPIKQDEIDLLRHLGQLALEGQADILRDRLGDNFEIFNTLATKLDVLARYVGGDDPAPAFN